jgi:hypothetical protein
MPEVIRPISREVFLKADASNGGARLRSPRIDTDIPVREIAREAGKKGGTASSVRGRERFNSASDSAPDFSYHYIHSGSLPGQSWGHGMMD